ncbi:hypothetical protein BC941DRAFT_500812 [Chlamydoabsidia padenii]|nr:hypothetical protein BC941DRAFT_500812 [Chlamydoabsidia padenii]
MSRTSQWLHYPWIFFLIIWSVHADTLPPTFLQGCDVLNHGRTILCFGGTTSSVDVWHQFQPTSQFYSLDVSQYLTPDEAKSNWKPIAVNDFTLEPRAEFAHAIVNNTMWFVTSGAGAGTNYTEPSLVNNTLLYDITTNQWHTYKASDIGPSYFDNVVDPIINFTVSPVTHQLLGASACSMSNNKSGITPAVFLAGGFSLSNLDLIDPNITSVYDFVIPKDNQWKTLKVSGLEKPAYFMRSFRESCAYTPKFRVLLFGGFAYQMPNMYPYYNNTDIDTYASPFLRKGFFDIQANTINITTLDKSQLVPSFRYWHTLTTIPKTGKMLMFGGVFDHMASRDYCLVYDSDKTFWSLCDFSQSPVPGPGPRYGHSAVMVGDDLLYILFGADFSHQLVNDVHILNVTSMIWLASNSNNTTTHNTTSPDLPSSTPSSPSLTAGAIAGISIGGVAGMALIVVGAIIYVCAKKRSKAANKAKEQMNIIPEAPIYLTQDQASNFNKILITEDESKGDLVHQNLVPTKPSTHESSLPIKPADDKLFH